MTKEQVIKELRVSECYDVMPSVEALEMAINALEQKTSDDCVSRQELYKSLYERFHDEDAPNNITMVTLGSVRNFVKDFPPVIPTRKVGKWVIDDEEHGRIWHCHCSNCKKDPQNYIGGTENWWLVRLPKYCPNCGAEMEGNNEIN